jgi:hypothetical protein
MACFYLITHQALLFMLLVSHTPVRIVAVARLKAWKLQFASICPLFRMFASLLSHFERLVSRIVMTRHAKFLKSGAVSLSPYDGQLRCYRGNNKRNILKLSNSQKKAFRIFMSF